MDGGRVGLAVFHMAKARFSSYVTWHLGEAGSELTLDGLQSLSDKGHCAHYLLVLSATEDVEMVAKRKA